MSAEFADDFDEIVKTVVDVQFKGKSRMRIAMFVHNVTYWPEVATAGDIDHSAWVSLRSPLAHFYCLMLAPASLNGTQHTMEG